MTTATDWTKLPEHICCGLMRHYTRIECHIFLELELAGLRVIETDYNDDTWARYFTFKTEGELELFVSMVAFEKHPSGEQWYRETELQEGFTICIPRMDLHIVNRNLKRLNAIVVENYDEKKRRAIERTGYVDA